MRQQRHYNLVGNVSATSIRVQSNPVRLGSGALCRARHEHHAGFILLDAKACACNCKPGAVGQVCGHSQLPTDARHVKGAGILLTFYCDEPKLRQRKEHTPRYS